MAGSLQCFLEEALGRSCIPSGRQEKVNRSACGVFAYSSGFKLPYTLEYNFSVVADDIDSWKIHIGFSQALHAPEALPGCADVGEGKTVVAPETLLDRSRLKTGPLWDLDADGLLPNGWCRMC